jgi:hypothetical protein
LENMNAMNSNPRPEEARILIFSHRNIFDPLVWRCPFQEFQKVIQGIDSVEVLAPGKKSGYENGKRVALRLGEFVNIPLNPGVSRTKLNRDYEMFFTICDGPSDLLHLAAVDGWRDRCKISVCWLPEFYVKEIDVYKSCIKVLQQFDYVIFMYIENEPFKKLIRGKGQYLPAGIDTLRFCPYPDPPARSVDILSIGRRAPAAHKALLRWAEQENKFYVHDTIAGLRAHDLDEHRSMVANMAKRSRYFIVSPGKFDAPEQTGGQCEFGYRYFEAAAPGTIMIGMRTPNNPEFDKIFNWEDAVIEVPFDSGAIVDTIRELDKQPERQARISQTNILQCLNHHDWVYRWESVLNFVGMQPLPALQARKRKLQGLAEMVHAAPFELLTAQLR